MFHVHVNCCIVQCLVPAFMCSKQLNICRPMIVFVCRSSMCFHIVMYMYASVSNTALIRHIAFIMLQQCLCVSCLACLLTETVPVFTKHLESQTVQADVTVTFTCALSKPTKDVVWYRNGETVSADSHCKIVVEGKVHKLIIYHVSVADHAEYQVICGSQVSMARLNVQGKAGQAWRRDGLCMQCIQGILLLQYKIIIHIIELHLNIVEISWPQLLWLVRNKTHKL